MKEMFKILTIHQLRRIAEGEYGAELKKIAVNRLQELGY